MSAQRVVECAGRAMTINDWARELGYNENTMRRRLSDMSVEDACRGRHTEELWPGANTLPYAQDKIAQVMVSTGPKTHALIGAYLGIVREGVRKIEVRALEKLAALNDAELAELHESMREIRDGLCGWIYPDWEM